MNGMVNPVEKTGETVSVKIPSRAEGEVLRWGHVYTSINRRGLLDGAAGREH